VISTLIQKKTTKEYKEIFGNDFLIAGMVSPGYRYVPNHENV
jgi:hypothetical protein